MHSMQSIFESKQFRRMKYTKQTVIFTTWVDYVCSPQHANVTVVTSFPVQCCIEPNRIQVIILEKRIKPAYACVWPTEPWFCTACACDLLNGEATEVFFSSVALRQSCIVPFRVASWDKVLTGCLSFQVALRCTVVTWSAPQIYSTHTRAHVQYLYTQKQRHLPT